MQIILWRHAEANEHSQDDLNRTLTEKGHRQAQITAAWLAKHLPENYLLISSQAKRATQTADYLSAPLIDAAFNPGASVSAVHSALKSLWTEHERPIVLAAHQPFLGQVASLLTRGDTLSQPIKKSGIYWLKARGYTCYYKAILSPKLM